ncbi:hypothetical protein AMK59_6780 [Oryctes borbonicus]|uniref:SAC3/GANP/THP3 conserved domain-containing protein n=1 Tax=Oryctes borbonicus TaxID=1629725 RepID=A0A0T6AXJ1_9SCAR|nr:hypothetical protein AMK59_6780 [Oryctes borbonicus]
MAIRGTCTEMCPVEEMKFREKERMLHLLEMVPGTESLSKPKADKSRTVKIHTRSAAGSNMSLPKNLRTVEALLQTVNYLLNDVITSKILPWHHIYDFIADRLLAVRQDMLIQRLPISHYISLLEPIVRFYTYSAYRLCEYPIEQFDPVLNNNHLQECLKRLLKLYDESEYFSNDKANAKEIDFSSRPFFEALYIIFNLRDKNAIIRGLSINKKWRTEVVRSSLGVSMAVLRGNWYRACVFIKKLPTLLSAVVLLHLPLIRREALKRMEVAYNSKNLTYPLDALQKQLLYSNKTDLINDCTYYTMKIENDAIRFIKGAINHQDVAKPRQEEFVHKKLSRKNISDLVLLGDIW